MIKINLDFLTNGELAEHGILKAQEKLISKRIDHIWDFLRATDSSTKYFKVLHKIDEQKRIDESYKIAKNIRDSYEYFVFIGMGGAILNPMMLYTLNKDPRFKQKVFFINTTDPMIFNEVVEQIELEKTCIIAISSSGETTETISLYLAFKKLYHDAKINHEKHFAFIIGYTNSLLHRVALEHYYPIVEYDVDVGGRFSTYSNSAIMPGLIFGLDMGAYLSSFNKYIKGFWDQETDHKSVRSAMGIFFMKKKILGSISYCAKLRAWLEWYSQIISESLGKNKLGYAPIYDIGPMAQHTLYEYYLDGSDDVLMTFYNYENVFEAEYITAGGVDSVLTHKPLKEINDRLYSSSVDYFKTKKIPHRIITLSDMSVECYSELLSHSMVEVIFLSMLHNVHPFEQPSIDAFKKFTKEKYLKKA